MSDFAPLPLHFTDHVQWRYEVIRPLVLFADRPVSQRAEETQLHPDTVRRFTRRFQQQGMLGLFPICIKLSCLTRKHGFRPRERPPYNTRIPQSTGDSFGAFFFVYTATWGGLARGR
jgi:hypothetical protein